LLAAHASTSGSDNRHLMARMSMVAVLTVVAEQMLGVDSTVSA
jgi:hypothetical protein